MEFCLRCPVSYATFDYLPDTADAESDLYIFDVLHAFHAVAVYYIKAENTAQGNPFSVYHGNCLSAAAGL